MNFHLIVGDLLKDTAGSGGKWELDLADIYKTSNNKRYFFSRGRCTNCSQPGKKNNNNKICKRKDI